MTTYMLDTSAVLAHFCMEEGHGQVQALLDDPSSLVLIAAPSLLELDGAFKRMGVSPAERERVSGLYGGKIAAIVAADEGAVRAAIRVRDVATERLPSMDALIAGCALVRGGIVVHRDPHYDAIPPTMLRTWNILKSSECPLFPGDSRSVREDATSYAWTRRKAGRRQRRSADG
jgi:predicted nucleic acid-binding protein